MWLGSSFKRLTVALLKHVDGGHDLKTQEDENSSEERQVEGIVGLGIGIRQRTRLEGLL